MKTCRFGPPNDRLATVVVWIPCGWLVTHRYVSASGVAIHSVAVDDPAHQTNPRDFAFNEQPEEE